MLDLERLLAFALVTTVTSLVPGVSMMFVTGQAITSGVRAGWTALAGMQLGYLVWWCLAALGLGTLAAAYPLAFRLLSAGGALFLAYLGWLAIRHSICVSASGDESEPIKPRERISNRAFRDGMLVAIGNPKSLIYVVAIIPTFVAPDVPILPQIGLLAVLALFIDLAIGALYIGAGRSLARALQQPKARVWLDRVTGAIFIIVAVAILYENAVTGA